MGDTTSCQKCGTELPDGSATAHCEVCDPTPRAGIKVVDKTVVVPPNAKRPLSQAVPGVKDRFFGDYELIEEIAQGGMGVVYKARQNSLNRIVALKMILWGQFATEADVKRFLSEAEAASNLDHPNIVPIFQVGEHDGRHYFSMRFIDGGGLDEHIDRYRKDLRLSARLVATVARAVHFAHQRGILHRDLKPANILLDSQGQPYVTDFGLAKRVSGDGNVTHADVIMGSPNYMSPEQAAGGKIRLTTATDVYSLGAILYLLLTGRAPFESDSPMDTLKRLGEEEPRPPREWNSAVDSDLETICLKCLEKDPALRYGSAEALAEDLDRWRKHEPIAAHPVGVVGRSIKWAIRRPTAAALVAVLIGGAVTLLVLQWMNDRNLKREKDEAVKQRENAVNSEIEADKQRKLAEGSMLRIDIGNAVKTMDEGDQTGSLLWLAQALSLERESEKSSGGPGNAATAGTRDVNDRVRLEAILQTCPRLESFLTSTGVFLSHNVTSPDGQWVAEFSPKGGRMPEMPRPADGGFGRGKKGRPPFGRSGKPRPGDFGPVEVRLWNTRLGKAEPQSFSFNFAIHHAALSPDGTRIATATSTNLVEVFELKTGEPLSSFKPLNHRGTVRSIVFNAAGDEILTTSASSDTGPGEARVWSAETGEPITPAMSHEKEIESAAFSPDGKQLLTASADTTARLWDLPSGTMLQEFRHRDQVLFAAFSPDGDRVATACSDRTARVWEVSSGRELGGPMIHNFPVVKVLFSPDGRRLITANNDNTTRVWDISSASGAEMLGKPVNHNARLTDVRFGPDASVYLTVTETTARLWDATTGLAVTPPFVSHAEILHAALDADGRRLLVISADQTVWLWDVPPAHLLPTSVLPHGGVANIVAFSPDSKRLVTAGGKAQTKVWSTSTGKLLEQRPDSDDLPLAGLFSAISRSDHKNEAHSPGKKSGARLARRGGEAGTLSSDFRRIAIPESSSGKLIKVEDTLTDALIATVGRPPGRLANLVFNASGNHLALISTNEITGDGLESQNVMPAKVIVWDLAANKPVAQPFQLNAGVVPLCAALSPDGRRLLVGTDKNNAEIWTVGARRTDTNPPIRLEHSGDVISVTFSPDGSQVGTASADNSARVWNAATGEPATPFLIHEGRVVQAIFSPDGRRLLTASWDETARVWDAQTGEAVTPPLFHSSQVVYAAFSPDGNTIATAGEDGNVQLWSLPPSSLNHSELTQLAQLLSGRKMDNALSFAAAPRDVLKSVWDKMRGHLDRVTAPVESLPLWHKRLADQCDRAKDWYGERFHLDRLLNANPGDNTLRAQRDLVDEELMKQAREQKERLESAGASLKAP